MKEEEFKGKLVNCCFISKDMIYIDNKKAIELINQFKKDVLNRQTDSIICPFCNEGGFDEFGLKYHLDNYCDEFAKLQIKLTKQ